jgi:hypothetical protein
MAHTWFWRATTAAFVALTVVPTRAEATVDSVTVITSRDFEHADGYTYAEITVRGSVARADGGAGQYSVPAVVIYPRHGGKRVGVVDWLNSAFYHFFPPTREDGTFEFTRLATGNYLFEEGYTYLSIQWNKAVTHVFGPTPPADGKPHNHLLYGSIEQSADAWEILRDAARLLKDPRAYPGHGRPKRVKTVLSSGYSQGGALQLELLAEGLDPTRVYDGHLVQMIGLTCWKREDVPPHFGFFGDCRPLPTHGNHAPVMVLASDTDMVGFHPTVLGFGKSAFFLRNPANPRWRQYEMAGVSHLPQPILRVDLPNQNTADPRPIFRAAFDNLARWTDGDHRVKPPDSRYIEGSVDASDAFIPESDDDGHYAGGVRLPHVESRIHGHVSGGPLGRHEPLNPLGQNPPDPFKLIGGVFSCFGEANVLRRYGSHERYVKRVKRAADHLAYRRYITARDRWALIAAATHDPFPPACDDDGNDRTPAARPPSP